MANRHLREFGLYPWFAYLLIIVTFPFFSNFLYFKTEYAPFIFLFLSIFLIFRFSEKSRNDFLKFCFKAKDYRLIRLLENLIVALPFVVLLIVKNDFLVSLFIISISSLLAIFNFNRSFHLRIPTPFYKMPFEFTAGFRRTFYIYILAFFIFVMALSVSNFYLGIFSILITYFTSMSYYYQSEPKYFVWIFNLSARQFLFRKIKTAFFYASFMPVPPAIILGALFPDKLVVVVITLIIGHFYVLIVLLAKYSTFPKRQNLPEELLVTLCILMPPAILLVAPYLYKKSINRLNTILE